MLVRKASTIFRWNFDRAELIADGIVHIIGILLASIGAIALIAMAKRLPHVGEFASVLVYVVGLLAMIGISAAYNLWPVSPIKWLLRRFDHSAIYVLIASTYTPFVVQMTNGLVKSGLLIGVWSVALFGVLLKLFIPGRFDRFAIVIYLALGWSGAFAYEAIAAAIPSVSLWLIGAGGLLYSAGVVFHVWESLRFQNAIWHGFVLAASSCFYNAVLATVAFAATP